MRLYASALLVDAAGYAYHAVVPAHAKAVLHAPPEALGLLGTVTLAVYAFGCLLSGRWSDRGGGMLLSRAGLLLLLGGALPGALLAEDLPAFFAAGVALGAGLALFWPPIEREIALLAPRGELGRVVGTFNSAWAFGIALGSFWGPELYVRLGLEGGLGLAWGAAACALALTAVPSFPADACVREADGGRNPIAKTPQTPAAVHVRFLRLAWVVNFAALFAYQGAIYLLPHVLEASGQPLRRLGSYLLLLNGARWISFLLLRRSERWHYRLAPLLGGGTVTCAALAYAAFAPSPLGLAAAFAVLGLYCGLTYYSSLYYGLAGGEAQGARSGIHEAVLASGMTAGPLACGLAAGAVPGAPGAAFAAAAAAIAVSLGLAFAPRGRLRRT